MKKRKRYNYRKQDKAKFSKTHDPQKHIIRFKDLTPAQKASLTDKKTFP